LGAALDLITSPEADGRRARLARNGARLRTGLCALGYNTEPSRSQIVPLQPGTEERICRFQRLLDRRGVFGAAFIPPSVSRGRCVQRLSVHSELTDADLDRVLDACAAVRDEAGLHDWKSTRRLAAA
jgi:CAI-1 autoinducer synthase